MKCTLDDVTYDKIKLLHKLSSLEWFIKKHAHPDAKTVGDESFKELLETMCSHINHYIQTLEEGI
jgi:hypothetical protein